MAKPYTFNHIHLILLIIIALILYYTVFRGMWKRKFDKLLSFDS